MNKLIFTAFILSNMVFSQTPYISGTIMSSDNTSIIVTFSEAVYNSTGGSGALETSDFALSLCGGLATLSSATPTSISASGNVYTLGLPLVGAPNGFEIISVLPHHPLQFTMHQIIAPYLQLILVAGLSMI